jgi:phage shock protein E
MKQFFKNIFAPEKKVDFAALVKNGATIVDVRTADEFSFGHIENAINIPLDQIESGVAGIEDKNALVILCCASGSRSAYALSLLKAEGYAHVYNGAGWRNLQQEIK